MSRDIGQVIKDVMSIILNIEAARIEDDTSMDKTPGWDSANHINLILALEEEFSISFDVSEFELMSTYFDIHQVVASKI